MRVCGQWLITISFGLTALGCAATNNESTPTTVAGTAAKSESPVDHRVSLFGDRPELETLPFETRTFANVSQHTFTTDGLDFDPDIDATGDALVFASTRNSTHPDIFIKPVSGATLMQLVGDAADDIQPRFSPDGEKVVFCSNRSGNWDVWVINRDGTGLTQLTDDRTDEVAPGWSPDGLQLVYSAWGARSHQWELWTLRLAQPGVKRFLGFGSFPAWSPDGKRIAFQKARQRGTRWFSIWTIELVNGEARQPTEVAFSDTSACISPRWSPEGGAIVYCAVPGAQSQSREQAELWTVGIADGSRLKLTDGAVDAVNPVWSKDGRVYFVSARSGSENIWSLTVTADEKAVAGGPWGHSEGDR